MLKPGDVGYPGDCQPKPAVLVYTQHVDDVSSSFVDDPLGTDNPTVICHGKTATRVPMDRRATGVTTVTRGHGGQGATTATRADKGDKGDTATRATRQHGEREKSEPQAGADPGYPSDCQPKPASSSTPARRRSVEFVRGRPSRIDNPTVVCNGKDGKDGNPGKAYGWHKKFTSAPINSTSTGVLSQTVSGTNSYMVDAKLNAPFAKNQSQVTCVLVAVENGVTSEIDRLDTLALGTTQRGQAASRWREYSRPRAVLLPW